MTGKDATLLAKSDPGIAAKPMAQAELEEKFKGIGLAEATAKCESYHLAYLLAYYSLNVGCL